MKKLSILITLLLVFLLSVSVASAQEPTAEPGEAPVVATAEPESGEPVTEPAAEPTAEPTAEPVEAPVEAVEEPLVAPTAEPTEAPVVVEAEEVVAEEVSAAAIPALTSGFQLQNLGAAQAAITISFYDQNGGLVASPADTIAAGGSNNYFPLDAVSSGFNGSVVVSSDQSLAGIVNLLGVGGAGSLNGGASYDSISQGSTTVNLPLVLKELFGISSFVNVQNTSASAADVTVSYPGTSCSQTINVPANSSKTFDQSADTCLTSGFLGSAIATSSASIVAAVVEYDADSLLAYNGFTTSATNPVMPLVIGNFVNTDTGIQIQNAGTQATNVTVTYTPSPGNPGATCTETQNIAASQSANFGVGDVFASTSACLAGTGGTPNPAKGSFVGGASVTTNSADQPLVVIVNQATIGGANSSAYGGFDPTSGTNQVSIPLIVKDLPLAGGLNLFTGFNLVNVGSADANVTCTFANSAVTVNQVIAPGVAANIVQSGAGSALPAAYVGSAVCTGGATDSIVAVVNQVGGQGDALLTYEGFNQ